MIVIGVLGLIATIVGVAVTLQVRDEVQGLAEMTPQEVINDLRVGMTTDEMTAFLEVEPQVDEIIGVDIGLDPGITVRRVHWWLPEKRIWISAVADSFSKTRLLGVTTDDASLRLRFPSSNTGSYAYNDAFTTNETTLGELQDVCINAVEGWGWGANWGNFAIGCKGIGANNYNFNVVGVNFHAPGFDQPGICCSGRPGEQIASGVLDEEVAAITFNSFAWGDHLFWADASVGTQYLSDVVLHLPIGPWQGDTT